MGKKMSGANERKQKATTAEISDAENFRTMFETFDWTQYT